MSELESVYEECGNFIPPNIDCISKIPLPSILNHRSLKFIAFSLFVILINAILVIYVLKKIPKRKKSRRRSSWHKSEAQTIYKMEVAKDGSEKSKSKSKSHRNVANHI